MTAEGSVRRPNARARPALYATARIEVATAPAKSLDSLLRSLRWRRWSPYCAEYSVAVACEAEDLWRFSGREADRLAGDSLGAIAREAEDELGRIARRLRQRAPVGRLQGLASEPFVRPTFAVDLVDVTFRGVATAFAHKVQQDKAVKLETKSRDRIVLRALAKDVAALADDLVPRQGLDGEIGDEALATSSRQLVERIRGVLATTAPRRRRTGRTS